MCGVADGQRVTDTAPVPEIELGAFVQFSRHREEHRTKQPSAVDHDQGLVVYKNGDVLKRRFGSCKLSMTG